MVELVPIEGCSDHGCKISKPKGIGTNATCRCNKDPIKVYKVLYNYSILQNQVKQLEEENAKLKIKVDFFKSYSLPPT